MCPLLAVALCMMTVVPAWAVDVTQYDNTLLLSKMLEPTPIQKEAFAPWETSFWLDENGDGKFTFTELKSWVADVFYFPGSVIVYWIWGTGFGQFFEITPVSFRSGGTGFLSLICWFWTGLGLKGQFD